LIPEGAEKPVDGRRARPQPKPSLAAQLTDLIAATARPLPEDNPDGILDTISEKGIRLQYEAELAYLRGDFKRAMGCFTEAGRDDAARIYAAPMAIAAAISMGDYPFYTAVDSYLKQSAKKNPGTLIASYAEMALATVAVSSIAPNMAPDWLKNGDLSAFPVPLKPYALYLRAKYFQCLGRYEPMLAVAQTVLTLHSGQPGITKMDIYLRLLCAIACYGLERREEGKSYLLEAMAIALPHGFITPFAESVTALGGLLEQCLEEAFPDYYQAVIGQWQDTWKNWISFHNQFTRDNITHILTLREFHIATLVARRVPYVKIAEQYGVSVGRLKNIITDIYGKLLVSSRDELAQYVF
jgi:DNA-binding CsgD family transcriptional regulator